MSLDLLTFLGLFFVYGYNLGHYFFKQIGNWIISGLYSFPPKLRAAPEVNKDGLYSGASDVFCFGNFVWEVLTTYDNMANEYALQKVIYDAEDYSCYAKEVGRNTEVRYLFK